MNTTDYYMIAFLILFFTYAIADLVTGKQSRDLYRERTNELKVSNDIRRQTYIEKYKPTISSNPSPMNNVEYLANASKQLRKGKGIGALFSTITKT